jgi:Zn-dependent protease
MFGTDVRVHPLFWVSSALLGVRYYHDPEGGGVGMFVFWMATVFVCLLLHEFGHVAVARLFGARPRVGLGGLGGRTLGFGELRRWQRVAVLLAGPLVTFSIVGVLLAITATPFPAALAERGWASAVANGWYVATWCNLVWGVLNLLPLWPLDGGQIAGEAAEGVLGRHGVSLALLLSIGVAGALTLYALGWARAHLVDRYDPHYPLYLGYSGVLLLYCFVFWVSGFKGLWAASPLPSDKSA